MGLSLLYFLVRSQSVMMLAFLVMAVITTRR